MEGSERQQPTEPTQEQGGGRTFKQDILLAVFTAVIVGIVSFGGMMYQLRQAKQRDIYQAKDQLFKDFVKASEDYHSAAVDFSHLLGRREIKLLAKELSDAHKEIGTNAEWRLLWRQ